jgi:hypothetical protein
VTRRMTYAIGWAALCALVLSHVPANFERIRVRIVTTAIRETGRSIAVPLPDLSRLSGQPAAIIVRLGGAADTTHVRISFDDAPLADVRLEAGRDLRVDASAWSRVGPGHSLMFTGDRDGWQLDYLEIANVHGHSSGVLGFAIVPRALDGFARLPIWWVWPAVLGYLAWRSRPGWPEGRLARRLYLAGVSLVLLLFVTTVATDRVTPFKVLLTPGTFLWCAAMVHAQHVVSLARLVVDKAVRAAPALLAAWRSIARAVRAVATQPRTAAIVAGAASVAVFVAALALGSHVAGGADAYGYVSQSALWAQGTLHVDQPIVKDLPDYVTDWVIAPLGFVPQNHAGVRGRIVPYFSPGLPMFMAPLRLMFGPGGVFLVVPILAALAVWLTFIAGRRLHGHATGLIASLWLAVSPAFLASAFAPMSDVPAMTWWLAALVASFRPTAASAAAAGLATSAAVLTRPNLVPLALVVALPFIARWVAEPRGWRTRGQALALYLMTSAIGPIVSAAIFNHLFGSPFQSGYGTIGMNVDWSNVLPNLDRYPRWLITSQTLVIGAGLVTPFLLRGRTGRNGLMSPPAIAWLMLAASAVVWMTYLLYFQFDSWMYLRFLLPSYPLLIALASAGLVLVLRRVPAHQLVIPIVVVSLLVYELNVDQRHSLFSGSPGEMRYRIVGEFVERTLPAHALLLSAQHSGSLRYYSGRTTLRYDQIPSDRLDELIAHLERRGYPLYIVLDSWEVDEFRKRFAAQRDVGSLGWTPAALLHGSTDVKIYDVRDRTRQGRIETRIIQ